MEFKNPLIIWWVAFVSLLISSASFIKVYRIIRNKWTGRIGLKVYKGTVASLLNSAISVTIYLGIAVYYTFRVATGEQSKYVDEMANVRDFFYLSCLVWTLFHLYENIYIYIFTYISVGTIKIHIQMGFRRKSLDFCESVSLSCIKSYFGPTGVYPMVQRSSTWDFENLQQVMSLFKALGGKNAYGSVWYNCGKYCVICRKRHWLPLNC